MLGLGICEDIAYGVELGGTSSEEDESILRGARLSGLPTSARLQKSNRLFFTPVICGYVPGICKTKGQP